MKIGLRDAVMPTQRGFFLASISAASLLLVGSARALDVDTLIDPIVALAEVDGQQVGCNLSFHIGRGPLGSDMASAIGVTVGLNAAEDYWQGSLKIGFQAGVPQVTPPQTAFLLNGEATNEGEINRRWPANEDGYLLLAFSPGPETSEAYARLTQTGIAHIGFKLSDGVAQTWTLDLTYYPEVLTEWSNCLATFPRIKQSLDAIPLRARS